MSGISPKQAHALRWVRTDARPWTKTSARWEHASGWRLEHCGHPTALRPWALFAPDGRMVLTGAKHAVPPDPTFGTAWPNLGEAMLFVAMLDAKRESGAERGSVQVFLQDGRLIGHAMGTPTLDACREASRGQTSIYAWTTFTAPVVTRYFVNGAEMTAEAVREMVAS